VTLKARAGTTSFGLLAARPAGDTGSRLDFPRPWPAIPSESLARLPQAALGLIAMAPSNRVHRKLIL